MQVPSLLVGIFSFYEQLKFPAQLIWAWKKFYNLGAWFVECAQQKYRLFPETLLLNMLAICNISKIKLVSEAELVELSLTLSEALKT